jgi:hypothetical protein
MSLNTYLEERIPIGSLVRAVIANRIDELGIIIDANYGLVCNSWYLIHGMNSGKYFYAYPNEVVWLRYTKEKGDE